jgi:hypothetical protein
LRRLPTDLGAGVDARCRIVLETDSNAIAARVSRPRADVGAVDLSNITINEQVRRLDLPQKASPLTLRQTIMHAFRRVALFAPMQPG